MTTAQSALICTIVCTIVMHSANVDGAPLTSSNESDMKNNSSYPFSLLDPENGLFEGDIEISEDLIRKYYNLNSMPGGEELAEDGSKKENANIEKRAAIADNLKQWRNAQVPYQFSSGISSGLRFRIRSAMDHWEDNTCLRFPARNGESDYVEYDNAKRKCSSYVGRVEGKQTINVYSGCRFGSVVHEIGHAVGFWHEQSRPDRDNYVRINNSNIRENRRSNFMKRTNNEVNSRGSVYDYGSIMHYSTTAFVQDNCVGCKTIEVTNTAAFEAQGSPRIGQRDGLSVRDIQQANNLYACPRRGVRGELSVRIRSGQSLPVSYADPYVKITAIDSFGVKYSRSTTVKNDENYPYWNEYLHFPKREWQFFRIQVWDEDYGNTNDDVMSISETVVVTPGVHNSLRHYSRLDSFTDGYVLYDYKA